MRKATHITRHENLTEWSMNKDVGAKCFSEHANDVRSIAATAYQNFATFF